MLCVLNKTASDYWKTFSCVSGSLSHCDADQNAILKKKRNIVRDAIKFYDAIITDIIVQGCRGL